MTFDLRVHNAGEDDGPGFAVRDYKIMRCDHSSFYRSEHYHDKTQMTLVSPTREYFAIGQGDDDVGESEVYIGTQHQLADGTWSELLDDHCCDYDEIRATQVGVLDNVKPSDVAAMGRKVVEAL